LSRQKNTTVLLGTVVDVDPVSKRVLLADGASLPYDSLIVAAGSQSSYFGHENWREWAPGLKSIEEATHIRHKILYAFEVAERIADPVQRRNWLRFVIVGGGCLDSAHFSLGHHVDYARKVQHGSAEPCTLCLRNRLEL